MGQKVHPYGIRLGYIRTWKARWFSDKNAGALLHEDLKIHVIKKRRLVRRFSLESERFLRDIVKFAFLPRSPGV